MSEILIPNEIIENKIYLIRNQKVMIDRDLALLYGVETKQLKRQVRRNIERFPEDFMFRLTTEEWEEMMSSQIVMTSKRPKSALPFAFTEHGVTMLASVLKSPKARKMNIAIVRAFVALRKTLLNIESLKSQIQELETKYDKQFEDIFEAIQFLITDNDSSDKKSERVKIGYKK